MQQMRTDPTQSLESKRIRNKETRCTLSPTSFCSTTQPYRARILRRPRTSNKSGSLTSESNRYPSENSNRVYRK